MRYHGTLLSLLIYIIGGVVGEDTKTIKLKLNRKPVRRSLSHDRYTQDIKHDSYFNRVSRNLTSFTMEMDNFYNYQYYASLFIGDNDTELTFLFDSGSDYLWIPLNNGTQGYSDTEYTPTSTFSTDGIEDGIEYGSGEVTGVVATDQISLEDSGANFTMQFLAVDYQDESIDGLQADGIMGLSPEATGYAELFVTKLYDAGLISLNSFGVNFMHSDESSYIMLGGYDTTIVSDSSLFEWIDLIDTDYWSIGISKAGYGDSSFSVSAERAIIDTGTSLSYFSSKNGDWDKIYGKVKSGKSGGYSDYIGQYAGSCTSDIDFEDIFFVFGDYRYYMPRSSYVEYDDDLEGCALYISPLSASFSKPTMILGDSFLRNYYVYHDVTNQKIGFYGTIIDDHASNISILVSFIILIFLITM